MTAMTQDIKEIQTKATIADIGLHKIRIDRTQSRCKLDDETVAKYVKEMDDGVIFDPAIVYHDVYAEGETFWLADGFHRYAARKAWGANTLTCEVRIGTERDALRWSLGANAKHGLRRTNDDKWRAVKLALDDDEWSTWSNVKLAELCGVSDKFVGTVRLAQSGSNGSNPEADQAERDSPSNGSNLEPPKRIGRDGKTYPASKQTPSPDTEDPDFDDHADDDDVDPVALEAEAPTTGSPSGRQRIGHSDKSGPS